MFNNNHEVRIQVRGVRKVYDTVAGGYVALDQVDFDAATGEFVAIVGRSGSGKSTLLNMISGIDRPTSGSVVVNGESIGDLTESKLARWRCRNLGLVFQFQQLLPTLTVAENVMLPMDFAKRGRGRDNRVRALELLDLVDVSDQSDKLPASLSGGQQQRAAIARALANDPPVIVADEPTGNLDSHTADETLETLRRLAGDGKTVVMVTHEHDVSRWVDRVVTMSDGRLFDAASLGALDPVNG